MKKNICFFGSYESNYSRNILTKKAFKELGWNVIDCNVKSSGFLHNFKLSYVFFKKCRQCSIIFVPVLGHFDIPLAWIISKVFSKKLIFDAFYSVYDTYVLDRKLVGKNSLSAFRYFFYDKASAILADKVIFDTKENIDFFKRLTNVNSDKFCELPVTVDMTLFKYSYKEPISKNFAIGFYGSFLPLHGVDIIIEAIDILREEKDIRLILLGYGQKLNDIKRLIKRKKLSNKITIKEKMLPYDKLSTFYSQLDVFLPGPFGESDKAKRVFPAKAVESLAIGLPTIMMETECTLRILKGYKGNVFWVKSNEPKVLANKILWIKNNKKKIYKRSGGKDFFSRSELGFNSFKKKLSLVI